MDIKSLAGIKTVAVHFIQALSSSCVMEIRLSEETFGELRATFRKARAV